jgi:hypothetical protein
MEKRKALYYNMGLNPSPSKKEPAVANPLTKGRAISRSKRPDSSSSGATAKLRTKAASPISSYKHLKVMMTAKKGTPKMAK